MIERDIAQQRIKEFARRYGETAVKLACHAALPVVVNVELLHLLRINFFLDSKEQEQRLDATAEFELLLSPLCYEIGDGLYELDPTVREALLKRLIEDSQGTDRIREIGELLRRYGDRFDPWQGRSALQRAQELTALDALDHQKALHWLEQAEQDRGASAQSEEAWFVAMRAELQRKERLEQEAQESAFWQEFSFDVVTVDEGGKEIERRNGSARQFSEELKPGVFLEMVQVPGGTFLMGSPPDEAQRNGYEGPQHEVTVSAFCMGKYPVTQAQWKAIMREDDPLALRTFFRKPRIRDDPSYFKGTDRPVENVTWYEAQKFCQKLSAQSGREYRLPSEAEWEYACRAGNTTPFHFGPTITNDLANYRGDRSYADELKGKYRGETTPVGYFGHANAFGLYDMHGNVWEWCQDDSDSYNRLPKNGKPQIIKDKNTSKVLRGGSWVENPERCRCASRYSKDPGLMSSTESFRIVAAVTLI